MWGLSRSRQKWDIACSRMLEWSKTAKSDDGLFIFLSKHFSFCSSLLVDCMPFDAVLKFDVKIRRGFAVTPSPFDAQNWEFVWNSTYTQYLAKKQEAQAQDTESRMSSLEAKLFRKNIIDALHTPPPAIPKNIKQSYNPICLLCGERNHQALNCSSARGSVYCKFNADPKKGSKIITSVGNNPICSSWNASGKANTKCQSHKAASHACSFCGSQSHHAFSWTCKSKPN